MPMDPNDPRIQEFIKNSEGEPKKTAPSPKKNPQQSAVENPSTGQKTQLFKRKRAGKVLTREEVKQIKDGRRKLRKELRSHGIKDKSDFDLMASGQGLYFDKPSNILDWLWRHKLGMLLLSMAAVMAVLLIMSLVTQTRGHFTINVSDGMFREGFTLSETADFKRPTTYLFATPAEDVPCISFRQIPETVDQQDGSHNAQYFAYTFYIRNEGENVQDYLWYLRLNSESQSVSSAVWAMVFEDGKMRFYAKADEDGNLQTLPAKDDNDRGYPEMHLGQFAAEPENQYELIFKRGEREFYRILPYPFASDTLIAEGQQSSVTPGDIHKYTVVLWLEGDDPDCTDQLIGGHIGVEFGFRLLDETIEENRTWEDFWHGLKFW